jgi:hypothetical protein
MLFRARLWLSGLYDRALGALVRRRLQRVGVCSVFADEISNAFRVAGNHQVKAQRDEAARLARQLLAREAMNEFRQYPASPELYQ